MESPNYILMMMRQRRGLEADDKSRDAELQELSPLKKLRMVCGWKLGDPYWAETFIEWAKDCGLTITPED